jgi:vacuolar-type H+-ATPase subunit H
MKRIIEEVFQAEDKVSAILKQARQRASEIRRAAEKEAAETVSEAKQKAQEAAQTMLDEAREEAERLRQERLRQGEQDAEAMLHRDVDETNRLVEDVCNAIVGTEYEKGTL